MKTIPLTQGKVALVDDEDFEWLNQFKWWLHRNLRDNTEYAVRPNPTNGSYLLMHRGILGVPANTLVRFRDGDTLNLQRANLIAGRPPLLDGPYPNTKLIELTQRKFAIVDANLAEYLSQWKWSAKRRKTANNEVWYALGTHKVDGKFYRTQMHRLVMGATAPDQGIDHRNHDGLDNRRENLRFCTDIQNHGNMRGHSISGYKGVYPVSNQTKFSERPWRASIKYHKKSIHLGSYASAEEAARAYDAKAIELFGDFAHLNFPPKVTPSDSPTMM